MTDTDSFNISYMAVSMECVAQLILYHGKVILAMYTDITAVRRFSTQSFQVGILHGTNDLI
jgi:hypothetical protein